MADMREHGKRGSSGMSDERVVTLPSDFLLFDLFFCLIQCTIDKAVISSLQLKFKATCTVCREHMYCVSIIIIILYIHIGTCIMYD